MRASAFDPPSIPPAFWERPDVCQALRKRDMGALFRLLRQYTGLSQTRIGTAVGLGQGRISEVVNGIRGIRHAHVFERIADGLDMPDHARILLGLSPRQITRQHAPAQHHASPARPGHRAAPADHRGPQHRQHRRPRPAGRNRQHPAPGPPPRRTRRRRQARSPHQPRRDRPALLPAPWEPPAARRGPGRRLRPGRMAGHRHGPPAPRLGALRARHRRRPRSRRPLPARLRRGGAGLRPAGPAPPGRSARHGPGRLRRDPHRHPAPGPRLATRRRSRDGRRSRARIDLPNSPRQRRPGNRPRPGQRGPSLPRPQRDPPSPLARQLPGHLRRPADSRRPQHRTRPRWTTASPAPKQACAATWPPPCTSAASKTKPSSHLKRARELAQVTGSARQRRRIRDLSKRIAKAA